MRLRELRARGNLTQDEVASAIGCHESAISRWESGTRLPSCVDLLALSRFYRVSCDELLANPEQHTIGGSAMLDQSLLDELAETKSVEEFDAVVSTNREQTAWVPVPPGAVIVPVQEAMRRARRIADRFPDSRFADRLFRPTH